MNFCSQCGERVATKVPPGDNRERFVCDHCGTIHYENPRNVVGCICEWQGKILLCRRSIEPRSGYWTAPAGFMENGETVEDGAMREVREEAMAEVDLGTMLAVVNVPHVNQVHIMFRATLIEGRFGAGEETLEAELFAPQDIPWEEIAFPSVTYSLKRYLQDRKSGHNGLHITRVPRLRRPGKSG